MFSEQMLQLISKGEKKVSCLRCLTMFPLTDVRRIRIRGAPECDLQKYVSKTMAISIASLIRTLEIKWSHYFRMEEVINE